METIGISVYGCERDEADAFVRLAPRYGVVPALTRDAASEANTRLAHGNRCVSVGHKSRVSLPVLRALRDAGIRFITTRSVGCDHIDMHAAKALGIAVGNAAYSPGSVADYTLMLILMAIRNAKSIVSSAEQSDYRLGPVRGTELRDMTVGVLGTGRIGMAVIERLRGFGCRVLAYGHGRQPGVRYVSLSALLWESDVLTIHVPLTGKTRHMIGREQIRAMKQGAYLINTARGGIVDTGALLDALQSGKLGGAALDVLEGEEGLFYFDCTQKPIDNRFLPVLQGMPNVIITPHTAYYTGRALEDTIERTIENCLDFERRERFA